MIFRDSFRLQFNAKFGGFLTGFWYDFLSKDRDVSLTAEKRDTLKILIFPSKNRCFLGFAVFAQRCFGIDSTSFRNGFSALEKHLKTGAKY